jgi:hypothetical protein
MATYKWTLKWSDEIVIYQQGFNSNKAAAITFDDNTKLNTEVKRWNRNLPERIQLKQSCSDNIQRQQRMNTEVKQWNRNLSARVQLKQSSSNNIQRQHKNEHQSEAPKPWELSPNKG